MQCRLDVMSVHLQSRRSNKNFSAGKALGYFFCYVPLNILMETVGPIFKRFEATSQNLLGIVVCTKIFRMLIVLCTIIRSWLVGVLSKLAVIV